MVNTIDTSGFVLKIQCNANKSGLEKKLKETDKEAAVTSEFIMQNKLQYKDHSDFFFLQSFLSRPFTNHRTAEEGRGYFFSSSLSLHPLHRQLNISRAVTARRSPLHLGSSWTRTGNLWFPSASCYPLSCAPKTEGKISSIIDLTATAAFNVVEKKYLSERS